jgi:hypothetical protein
MIMWQAQVLANLSAVLEAAGSSIDNVSFSNRFTFTLSPFPLSLSLSLSPASILTSA